MTQAIFLSYASQDADAARRICDALRAAGLEVWFDQNELRGGDAWDASIRKQIKECALFVPIISRATEERLEGYFRLEWRLADQRTHLMAKGKPFLLPIVIDDTRDVGAHVPDSFLDVQWTRLPQGEAGETFAQRVVSLMQASTASPAPAAASQQSSTALLSPTAKARSLPVKLLAGAGIGLAIAAALVFVQPWKTTTTQEQGKAASNASPEIKQLVAQVEDLIRDPMAATRENYILADELMLRVLKAENNNADYWVLAARVSLTLWQHVYDRSARRMQLINEQVEKASKLSPDSLAVKAVQAQQKYFNDCCSESLRLSNEILLRDPANRSALQMNARIARWEQRDTDADAFLARLQKLPGGDPLSLVFDTLGLGRFGRFYEAEKKLDQLVSLSPTRLAYFAKLEFLKDYLADPMGATNFAAQIPPRFQPEEAIAGYAAEAYILAGRGDDALALLKQVPRDYLSEFAINVPKGTLVGNAYEISGRSAAAAAEWRDALALVEKRLSIESNSSRQLLNKALLQAMLGQRNEALETMRLRIELGAKDNPIPPAAMVRILVRCGKQAEAIDVIQKSWGSANVQQRSILVRDLA